MVPWLHLLPWLPSSPVFSGCYGQAKAPEVFKVFQTLLQKSKHFD
jgi:hypothetical protein